jgi:hypothetical protein
MKFTLPNRLLEREQGGVSRHSSVRSIYGDRAWIHDLDIVNELGGHTGCVNALRYGANYPESELGEHLCSNVSTVGPVRDGCWHRAPMTST